jgi:hypothetical protein
MSDLCPVSIEEIDGQWWVICEEDKLAGPFLARKHAERWVDENCEPMGI